MGKWGRRLLALIVVPVVLLGLAFAAATPASAAQRNLSYGDRGSDVRALQTRLDGLGYALPSTSWFGPLTRAAVKRFQGDHGVPTTGTVGPLTRKALASAGKPAPAKPSRPSSSSSGKKVVYLTFDDGPSPVYTKKVLDLLARYDAHATFFELGQNASAHPELTRAIVARGHKIGNHTWDHKSLTKLSDAGARREIERGQSTLERISGTDVKCLRPPYGAVNSRVRGVIRGEGLRTQLWDVDPQDWARPGAGVIATRVTTAVHPGDVVLMHDGGGNRTQTVTALASVLRTLHARGYTFASLPAC